MGRRPVGERPITAAERQRRRRTVLNDPIRHAVFARMLFELRYITDTDTATMREMTRRYDEAVAKGHAIPRTGGAVSNFQLTDERARALSKLNQNHPSRGAKLKQQFESLRGGDGE